LSCNKIDHTFPSENRNREFEIIDTEKKDYQLQLFHSVAYGFALRGNIHNPYGRYIKEHILKTIVDWCDFRLSQ
jgi:hypothetical protein